MLPYEQVNARNGSKLGTTGRGRAKSALPSTAGVARPPGLARHGPPAAILAAVRCFQLPPTADLQRPQIAQWYLDKKPSAPSASSPRFAGATSGEAYLEREPIGLPPSGGVAANDADIAQPHSALRSVSHRSIVAGTTLR